MQWGIARLLNIGFYTFTLPIAFSDTEYTVIGVFTDSVDSNSNLSVIRDKTTNSWSYDVDSAGLYNWLAMGF